MLNPSIQTRHILTHPHARTHTTTQTHTPTPMQTAGLEKHKPITKTWSSRQIAHLYLPALHYRPVQPLAGFFRIRTVLERHEAEALRDDNDSINERGQSARDAVFQNAVSEPVNRRQVMKNNLQSIKETDWLWSQDREDHVIYHKDRKCTHFSLFVKEKIF